RGRPLADRQLTRYFRAQREVGLRPALALLGPFYRPPRPPGVWFEDLHWGKTAGRTYENGAVHLVHPENWKNGRKYNSERQWIHTVYHEMGHYMLWADAERKADNFAYRFVRGVSSNGRDADGTAHQPLAASRARRKRPGLTRRRLRRRPRRSHSR